jgi:hypothetical protein
MSKNTLSSLQLSVLRTAPREWTILEDRNAWGPTIGTLVSRNLIERKRVGNVVMWRLKPVTFRQAVQRLVDLLPQGERAIKAYHAAHELLEVRAMLAAMPPESHSVCPLAGGTNYTEDDVSQARTLLRAA